MMMTIQKCTPHIAPQTLWTHFALCDEHNECHDNLGDTTTNFEYFCPISSSETIGHALLKRLLNNTHVGQASFPIEIPKAYM